MLIYVDVIGLHRYVVVGSLAWLYGSTVYPLHCYHPLPLLPISSNTLLYLLTALVSHYSCLLHAYSCECCSLPSQFGCSSLPTVVLTLCGVVGDIQLSFPSVSGHCLHVGRSCCSISAWLLPPPLPSLMAEYMYLTPPGD